MIKGKEKEQKSFNKKVGMFNATVVSVNPTKTELEKLLNTTIEKDPEYLGEGQTGNKRITLSFWLKESREGNLFNVRFNLEDSSKISSTGKHQYINSIGMTSYAEDKDKVPAFLTENKRELRVAKVGEELLYNFLRKWLSNLNYDDASTELRVDWKNLMKGKVTEIKEAIENFPNQEICCMATVRTSLDGKEYQGVYSYDFLPSYALDCFTGKSTKTYANKFIEKVTDAQHGCKDYYELVPLTNYDSSKNIISSNDALLNRDNKDSKTNISVAKNKDIEEAEIVDDLPF